ncbi:glycosyltransferase [Sphingomonas sp. ASV193]|uniref:glycosyltransferase n=1 Tax=Sphingomonas sp. ASV193 TaxID=3144405 RepID=UPI0032E8D638
MPRDPALPQPSESAPRVLTYLHNFAPGGVERVALRLVRRWRETGHDAPLLIGLPDGPLGGELAAGLAYDTPRRRFWSGWSEAIWTIRAILPWVLKRRADLLFCAGNTYTVVAAVMKQFLPGHCPPVVAKLSNDLIRPDLGPRGRWWYALWRRMQIHYVDHWVAIHPAMAAQLDGLVAPERISVIPDPALTRAQVERLRALPAPAPREGRAFVAMGRLVAQKDYPTMLAAFAAGAGEQDRLTIYGTGCAREPLERLAGELGIAERVRFAGYVRDAACELVRHEVLLLSSRYEGAPAVLIEALAIGLPVIATDCGPGVAGLVDDYPAAMMVAPGDVDAFAAAIGAMSASLPPRAAYAFDADAYTIEAGASAYQAVFRAVAARHASGRARPAFAARVDGLAEA